MGQTNIEWTDYTWNPWSGCNKISQGCKNCYAAALPPSMRRRAEWGADTPRIEARGGERALQVAMLTKYYGDGGTSQAIDRPGDVITTKARFGLVTVDIEGATYVVTDIGLRMLRPRELVRMQGFPDSYRLSGSVKDQIEGIGNSVCPPVAEALVRANMGGA